MSFLMSPPVRGHLRFRDVLRALGPIDWQQIWRNYFDAKIVLGFNSARSALFYLLGHLKEKYPSRNEVVIAAYTCPSVITSVRAAGLTPVLCDMAMNSCHMSTDQCRAYIGDKTLAVLTGNLFGSPDAVQKLFEICEVRGVILVEDLSLALGAGDSEKLGTIGHASIISFGMSKVISTAGGGLLVIRSERKVGQVRQAGPMKSSPAAILMNLLYPIALSRVGFGLLSRTSLAPKDFSTIDPPSLEIPWSEFQGRLSSLSLGSIETTVSRRKENCEYLFRAVSKSTLKNLDEDASSVPAYLRFPILANSLEERDQRINRLKDIGFFGTAGFANIRGFLDPKLHPNAVRMTECVFTVPCHGELTHSQLNRLATALS